MITYNDYDLAWYSGYCDIVEYLGGSEPSEDEIWEIARESSEVPNFENILYDIILTRITQLTEDKYGYKCNFYINSRDTHFYLAEMDGDQYEIKTLDKFKEYILNKQFAERRR